MPDGSNAHSDFVAAVRASNGQPAERYAYGAAISLPREPGARWTAEVPDLENCRSEGDGARECMANIADAVAAWAAAAAQRGEPLPSPTPLDSLARQPAFARALWLLVIRHDKPDDLEVSKALAEAGALPSLDAALTDVPGAEASTMDAGPWLLVHVGASTGPDRPLARSVACRAVSSDPRALSRRQHRSGIIADDSLDALAPQPQRAGRIINRPDMDGGPAPPQRTDQRTDGHRNAVPARWYAQRLEGLRTDASSKDRWQHQVRDIPRARAERESLAAQRLGRTAVGRRNDDAIGNGVATNRKLHRFSRRWRLEFDDAWQVAGQRLDDFVERRDRRTTPSPRKRAASIGREPAAGVQFLEFRDRFEGDESAAIGGAFERGIVHEHEHAIARHAQVEFHGIDSERHGIAK